MIWFLLAAGMLLVLLGVWGGPPRRRRPEKSSRIPREATVQEAWDILTSPVQYDEELIKIPEHRPWFLPGRDRRFQQGLMVGLGAGLLVAAVLTPFMPDRPAPGTEGGAKSPVVQGPEGQKPGGEPAASTPPVAEPTPAPPVQPAPEPKPEPEEITFVVEPGAASQEIAAGLKAAGLIASEQEFLDKVIELGVETGLKAGTFAIPSDASLEVVIAELTK